MSPVIAISSRAVTTADFQEFIGTRSVQRGWDALFSLWIVWSVTWLLRLYFSHSTKDGKDDKGDNDSKDGKDGDETSKDKRCRKAKRLKRVHKKVTHLLLGLLTALTFNSLAHGSTDAVQILSWVYFGVGLSWVHSLAWASKGGRPIFRLVGGIVQTGILLAIFILAIICRKKND
ncbi:10956_t:CDS:2 [Paraglomus occultum]|uniref:10956_t:CDS:1 n=1 Tax=Paraglomus occultum TaxID=144539 RepID=A0A9N9G5L6_9GLOM|nr:10956_t:CDS:2 [Paraglomus occultum]